MISECLSAYDLEYIDGYEPIIFNFKEPIEFQRIKRLYSTFSWKRCIFKGFLWLKLIIHAMILSPFYALYTIGKAAWERAKVNKRLKDSSKEGVQDLRALYDTMGESMHSFVYEKKRNHFSPSNNLTSNSELSSKGESPMADNFRASQLGEKLRDQAEMFVDSVFGALNSANYFDYHQSITNSSSGNVSESEVFINGVTVVDLKGKLRRIFNVELMPAQEAIVSLLNMLEWRKFSVIIRDTRSTHAALIYRHPDPHFGEGKVVVKHFTKEIFMA